MIMSLFRKDQKSGLPHSIYDEIVKQARNPWFYAECGAPDTVEGRFELLTIHVYLVLQRLKNQGEEATQLSQKIFDVFFENMDDSLREMGVGDLSVGKKIRIMAEAFYGRVGAYEECINKQSVKPLSQAISRNVFAKENAAGATAIADYLRQAKAMFEKTPIDKILSGEIPRIDTGERKVAGDEQP